MVKGLFLLFLGVVFGTLGTSLYRGSLAVSVNHTPPAVNLTILETPVASGEPVEQGVKEVSRRDVILRVFAADGSHFDAGETEFLDSLIGEDIDGGNRWVR